MIPHCAWGCLYHIVLYMVHSLFCTVWKLYWYCTWYIGLYCTIRLHHVLYLRLRMVLILRILRLAMLCLHVREMCWRWMGCT